MISQIDMYLSPITAVKEGSEHNKTKKKKVLQSRDVPHVEKFFTSTFSRNGYFWYSTPYL